MTEKENVFLREEIQKIRTEVADQLKGNLDIKNLYLTLST